MKLKFAVLTAALIGLSAMICNAANTVIVNGNGTNSSVSVAGTSYYVGTFPSSATNAFNLSTGLGVQSDTNAWPSAGVSLVGYPGTLYGPSRIVTISANGSLLSGSTATPLIFAGYTGTIWVTNAFTFTYTQGTPAATNWDTYGYQAIALQQVNNPNAGYITNLVVEVARKPGL